MSCKVCGSSEVKVEKRSIPFSRLGLDNIILRNVEHQSCENCGYTTRSFPKYNLIINQVRLSLVREKSKLSGKEFAFLREQLGFSGKELATLFGVTNVSISRWENEEKGVSPMADRLIRSLTLSQLKSNSIISILESISDLDKGDVSQQVFVDVSNFKETGAYAYSSGYGFGERSKKPATVYTNMGVDINCSQA